MHYRMIDDMFSTFLSIEEKAPGRNRSSQRIFERTFLSIEEKASPYCGTVPRGLAKAFSSPKSFSTRIRS